MARFFKASWMAPAWTFLIIVLLTIPGSSIPSTGLFEFDKFAHAGLFFVLTVLWLAALANRNASKAIGIVFVIVLFSFLSEWYQQLLPFDRTADVFDAIADTVGALLGLSFWGVRSALSQRQKNNLSD
jgi:VanZ family protein